MSGEAYLLNLSLVAVGFASVSALVMLLKQLMGGTLNRLDIHLITSYLSGAFSAALAALLPVLVSLGSDSPSVIWGVSGPVAAIAIGGHVVALIQRRRRIVARIPPTIIADLTLQGLAVVALLVNTVWPRAAWLYAAAVTLVLAMVMFAFLRRVVSLLSGEQIPHDWDMGRG